ncbi:MAG: YfiR family protein [Polyangiaceae bacterium]|nr:YfiR family protein [Polyangiaceae bacterium]
MRVPARTSRRTWLAASAGLLGLVWLSGVEAATVELPVNRQAKLISKLASYDRNFKARAGDVARILVVYKDSDVDSERTAQLMLAELGRRSKVGGLPHTEERESYRGASWLESRVVEGGLAIVYLCPGLESEMETVAEALTGKDVMTIGSRAGYAERRAVVSFDLVSGKPKLIVNLPQAKRQNVKFSARLLKLAEVIR